jgi:probable HAF family extracellular repeat protein
LHAWYFAGATFLNSYVWDGAYGLDGGFIADGAWHHIAFVVNSGGGALYVDGVLRAAMGWSGGLFFPTPGMPTTTTPLLLGAYRSGNGDGAAHEYFRGIIDDVAIWARSLSPNEIMVNAVDGPPLHDSGLVAFYPLDEESGAIAFNRESASHQGDLIGDPTRVHLPEEPAAFGTLIVNEETPTPVFLPGFDVEYVRGEATSNFRFEVLSGPTNGVLNRLTGFWDATEHNPVIYTPNTAYNGPDSFTYRIIDSQGVASVAALVRIAVAELNDDPILSPIPNLVIEQDTSTDPIPLTVDDEETPNQIVLTATSSDTRLVPRDNIVFQGTGTNRTMVITPAPGEIGVVTIEVTASDPQFGYTTRSFKLRVDPKPAYALVDLGDLGLRNNSFGAAVADSGWAVGWAQSQPKDARAVLYRGLGGNGALEDLGTFGSSGTYSQALGINADNTAVGFATATASGLREAFRWENGLMTSLASSLTGVDSIAYSINSFGEIVGSATAGNARFAWLLPLEGGPAINLGNLGAGPTEALDLNNYQVVVGYSTLAAPGNPSRAFRYDRTMQDLGVMPGHFSSRAHAINDDGIIVGWSLSSNDSNGVYRAFRHNGEFEDLGTLEGGSSARAYDINAFGQIVGEADNATSGRRAFLHTAGRMRDLNSLIHDSRDLVFADSKWSLEEARSITRDGTIVGVGKRDGRSRAFMAVPAWVIGRQIARPEGAVERMPEIEILSGSTADNANNSFFWSDFEKKLYPVRPVTARLKWFTSFQDTVGEGTNVVSNTERIEVVGISVWPQQPTIHIAEAPVEVEPQGIPSFNHSFQTVIYETTGGRSVVDPTSKIFNCDATGYSVLYYLETFGASPNPTTQRPYFDVVRTYRWNTPGLLSERSAIVGEKLTDPPAGDNPGHQDYLKKNGYVFFPLSVFDGAGPDRAYDRSTRLGPIIPVNLDKPSSDDDLVVIWYRYNRIGVAWASVPARYSLSWPDDADVDHIVIASTLGSGALDPLVYTSPRIYNQPDPSLPGCNPNEEHAFIAPSNEGTGIAVYALRNDLNALVAKDGSLPYTLLKYRDANTQEWSIKVFKVVAEQDPHFFVYSGIAGNEIQPPYPLSLLPLCEASHGTLGPYWEDYRGRLYARAAGALGGPTNIHVRWFYPLQSSFFYDLDRDGVPDAQPGDCLAWLDHHGAGELIAPNAGVGTAGNPIDVNYRITWPQVETLQIGETLMESKRGLPAIKSWARAQVIYDDTNPAWRPDLDPPPTNGLARLYDPLSTRVLALLPTEQIPAEIARVAHEGKEVFVDLPYVIRARLKYDPLNRWLEFSGILDEESYAGEPLLLPNVLSSRERDAIANLAPGNNNWLAIVTKLYNLTRNPNRVDADRDGVPDVGLFIGLTTNSLGQVVTESLGDLPKALTAGLGGIPAADPIPGNAVQFDGIDDYIDAGTQIDLSGRPFTIEFWIYRATTGDQRAIVSQGAASPGGSLIIGYNESDQLFMEFDLASGRILSPPYPGDRNTWVHWACVYDPISGKRALFRNALLVAMDDAPVAYTGAGAFEIGRDGAGHYFEGRIDDFRVWNSARTAAAIRRDRAKGLSGNEDGLVRLFKFDEATGNVAGDSSGAALPAQLVGGVAHVASTAPTGIPPRYMTLVENNDPSLGALPVTLRIIEVGDGPFRGDLKPILPDNVFDERITIRHSSDFGGDPDQVVFEWWYKPDNAGFDPEDLPIVNPDGSIADSRGWIQYTAIVPSSGAGVNDVTLGQGSESGLLTISDNWFICRYRGYDVGIEGPEVWSDWIGDPSGTTRPRAVLAEGWVKRVIRGLNPFDARVQDFHAAPVNTYASMLVQAGTRYEGPIAFNPSADNLNSIGLIEAYTTVLDRAKSKSINGTPPVNFNPANNALLLAASRIADLYMLLGNEAYADAQDPTIGFGTASLEYGSSASSIFAFQNQLDSLLEEELVLLRGRDDRAAGVGAPPVYNRLFWNFTLGEGEVAYQQTYNINDQNFDGFIDEKDARILYPQGHGDARGHYLTAIKTYYELLRHPYFTWVPRTERVNVAGVSVEVDYLDERKFARAAAALASSGRDIVDLTYRSSYVEDPAGQWQGYKDTDPDRAWGVTEWSRRIGQGAYFDWLTANAILPAEDPNPAHTGIQKIDRMTVRELADIADAARAVQATVDQSDAGLNPLGLAKGVVPFDIDPSEIPLEGILFGRTHFEQIRDRAIVALNNAVSVFDEANRSTQLLRQNQDSIDDLTRNARAQEVDYKNRLIEIYGYPYAGDIGPGKVYPSGYDGPDLYKYMYIDVTEITGESYPPPTNYTAFFKPVQGRTNEFTFYTGDRQASITDTTTLESSILAINYPISAGDYGFAATPAMGKRRAAGEIQMTLMELVQANADLKVALQDYDGLIQDIRDALMLLEAQHNLNSETLSLLDSQKNMIVGRNAGIGIFMATRLGLTRLSELVSATTELTTESLPKVLGLANDVTSAARGTLKAVEIGLTEGLDIAADIAELSEEALSLSKEEIALQTEIDLVTKQQSYEILQSVKALEALVRNEAALRIQVYSQVEQIRQIAARYLALLAEGARVQQELLTFRRNTAADVTEARYQDMTFRIFRNDALSKYRAQFDLAARYVYLAATAYDYESNLLGDDARAARDFLTDIVRQRAIGQITDGMPVAGKPGLADALARLNQNFEVIKSQFGLNNPQIETTQFSLRAELFRIVDDDPDDPSDESDARWRELLGSRAPVGDLGLVQRVDDLWEIPEFRRFCRPFAPQAAGPQPGIVIRFPSTVTFGLNFFGWPLGGADSSYDSSRFTTKVRSVGVWFSNYDGSGLSQTPRVYIVPVGMDIMRSPDGDNFATREWRVVDQALPTPFTIGASVMKDPFWIPLQDSLGGSLAAIRRHSAMRAYHDSGFVEPDQFTTDTRLIGRSVWNTEWMLIIPGGTFLADSEAGLDAFIDSNTDIKLYFQTYSYSGQ